MGTYISKYTYVLGNKKRDIFFLVFLFIILSFMDFIGIGLIGPFVAVVTSPDILSESKIWFTFKSMLWTNDDNAGLIVLGIIIVIIFIAKACGGYFAQKRIVIFSYSRQKEIISKLLASYQIMPYHYHLGRNSASLIQSIIRHTDIYTSQTLIASLRLISDTIVFFVILMLLALTNIFATISVVLFLVVLIVLYDLNIKTRMLEAGEKMSHAQEEIISGVNQSIGGLKEIRILGKEEFFHRKVENSATTFAKVGGLYRALTLMPRFMFESLTVTFIVGLSITSILSTSEATSMLPTLGIFGMAAIRLMPSGNTIVASINDLRYSRFALNELYKDLLLVDDLEEEYEYVSKVDVQHNKIKEAEKKTTLEFNSISINDVSYRYPNSDHDAIRDIDINIHRGDSIGIIGKTGCGKTTLVNVLLGLLEPQKGHLEIDGKPVKQDIRLWQRLFAYIPQDAYLLDDTIRNNIAFGINAKDIDEKKLYQVIKESLLENVVGQLPNGIDTIIGERGIRLSGGQRQMVALARSFYHNREIIVMDEATSSLDNETEKQIVGTIDRLKGKKTLIVIAHRLTTVKNCDYICRMESGKIVEIRTLESTPAGTIRLKGSPTKL